MTFPLLDLFGGAGGAGAGYASVGFTVTAVDIEPHEDSPHPLIVADALEVARELAETGTYRGITFAAVHASPPCPRWSTATANKAAHPDLITPLRPLLNQWAERTGGAWIIENVPGAPLLNPVKVCGSAFPELAVRRHRHFESNVGLVGTQCAHARQGTPVGVYGAHPDSRQHFRPNGTQRGTKASSLEQGQAAMGIDWMVWRDLAQAIPPAYTAFLGEQLRAGLEGVR